MSENPKDSRSAQERNDPNVDDYNVLALDPGRRRLGYAILSNKEVVGCGVLRLKNDEQYNLTDTIDEFTRRMAGQLKGMQICKVSVVERMRIYPGRSKGDSNHLLDIQAVGCAVGAKLAVDIRLVYPQDWKGTVKKDVTEARVKAKLDDSEKEVVQEAIQATPKQFHSDIWDAVGIGFYQIGR